MRNDLHVTMTKGDRDELLKLIRKRESTMKSAARQRSSQLLAEFETSMSKIHHWNSDETWAAAHKGAEKAIADAVKVVADRCEQLGIPREFAPRIALYWEGRGENAYIARQAEFRRAAKAQIEATEQAAIVKIEMAAVEAQQALLSSGGLVSQVAKSFLEKMPSVVDLMPALEAGKFIEQFERKSLTKRRLQ